MSAWRARSALASLGAAGRRLAHRLRRAGRGAARVPLIAAAARGDLAAVERLVREGADPGAENGRGWTALHEAMDRGHAEVAACLLAYGAHPGVVDRTGRAPLAPPYVTPAALHAVRQRYHRFRARTGIAEVPAPVAPWVDDLERRGIVRLAGLIDGETLHGLQRDFAAFIHALERRVARGEAIFRHYDEEEHWWPKERCYVSNNVFKYSPRLTRLCCDPTLLASATRYLGKPAVVQRGLAMRYLPSPPLRNDMFGWHHDMEERRLKVMILLSDVGAGDQHMSYVLGSHRLFHPYRMFFENACSLTYCRRRLGGLEIYDAVGEAGDAFIFDSNGAHRGNRRAAGRVRDVFLVEYSADRSQLWGGDVERASLDDLALPYDPFAPMLAAGKKWERPIMRTVPSWVESLPRVETWL